MANTVTLSADKTEINVGDTVIFSFTAPSLTYNNGNLYDSDWNLFISNITIPSTRSYTFDTIGTYRLRYVNSVTDDNSSYVTITVTESVHDYAIEFDEESYFACNGSCTVSATLTDNNVAVSGETVTLTGLGSSITATTDSNGVATFNLSSISEDKTLTVSFDEVSDTATLTYNLATLNGSLTCLGKRMASNLTAMGVTGVDYTDGLTSLADSILDIAPTITGIEFDTSVTCSSSESSVIQGTQITLTGVLEADYNDTSQVDVDLEGYLSGATVKLYNGNTLMGSAITDSNGAYSFNYTPQTVGTMSIIALFEGTTYFDTCSSNSVSVEVLTSTVLSLSATKDIISSADSESSTITATLTNGGVGVSGETLSYTIKHDSTVIDSGSDTTDSNGQISVTYTGTGVGDVDVIVSYGNFLQETYELQDFYYYDGQTVDKQRYSVITGTANLSYSNNGFRCVGTANVDVFVKNTALTLPTNYEMELTVTERITNVDHYGGLCFDDGLISIGTGTLTCYILSTVTKLGSVNYSLQDGDVLKIKMENNTISVYINDVLKISKSNINNTGIYQHRTYNNRGLTIKDLKVKAL